MKKWQIGAVAGALVFSLFATGCGEQIDQNAGIATSAPATEAPTEAATAAPELTERAKKLLAQNPDTVGYITIDGTQVDNPVVQTADNEYYLDHGFDGQEFRAGTVFMDCTDSFGAYPDQWSENIVLYGHNMADNTMFGSLLIGIAGGERQQAVPILHVNGIVDHILRVDRTHVGGTDCG